MNIVITGPDGSGKSTVCALVAEKLKKRHGSESVAICSIWDALAGQSVFSSKQAVGEYLSKISGEARTLFLFHAMSESLHLALRKKADLLLIDGYFYKYAVSELAYGAQMDTLRGAAISFPKPARSFYLSVTPEEAWKRKTMSSAYERGEGGDTEAAFLQFQKKMNSRWGEAEKEWGPWEHVPAGSAESMAALIEGECLKLREALR